MTLNDTPIVKILLSQETPLCVPFYHQSDSFYENGKYFSLIPLEFANTVYFAIGPGGKKKRQKERRLMKGNNLASGASSGSNLDVAIDMSRRQQRGLSIEKKFECGTK